MPLCQQGLGRCDWRGTLPQLAIGVGAVRSYCIAVSMSWHQCGRSASPVLKRPASPLLWKIPRTFQITALQIISGRCQENSAVHPFRADPSRRQSGSESLFADHKPNPACHPLCVRDLKCIAFPMPFTTEYGYQSRCPQEEGRPLVSGHGRKQQSIDSFSSRKWQRPYCLVAG